jgi:hypothetical protein
VTITVSPFAPLVANTIQKTWPVAVYILHRFFLWTQMLIGFDFVSELWPLMGLLFILLVIYEHGEPWWNVVDSGKLLIHPPELSGSSSSSHLVGSRRSRQRKWWIWPCKIVLFILASYFLRAIKSYDMEPPALLSPQRKACCIILSPLRIHCLGWVWTCECWVSWQAC